MAQAARLNKLALLDLGNNPINDPGFRAFVETPHLRQLRRLVVPGIGVTMARLERVRRLNKVDFPTLGRPTRTTAGRILGTMLTG